jgi:5-methyltetrahydropteroyltriglutamate--homocysteine methyltransferase
MRDYRNLFPVLADLKASQVVLEFANRGLDADERWRDWPRHLELGAGVVDVKAFKAETAAEVAERIRVLLRHVPADKLWLNPDCGFWETPRWVTRLKLAALVEGTRIVRRELGVTSP